MKAFHGALSAFALAAVLAGCSTPPAPSAPTGAMGANEGTITFTGGAVAAGIGFQWGSGTLTFRGRDYPVRVRGLSVADVGVTRVSATGRVRNLNRLEDFPGNYAAAAVGATVGGGGGLATMRNQNGVTIEDVSTSVGARLTLAPAGVNITFSGN